MLELKVGDYFRWKVDSEYKVFDVYGKVIETDGSRIKVITFDDFKYTTICLDTISKDREQTFNIVELKSILEQLEIEKDEINLEARRKRLLIDEQISAILEL